MAGPLLERLQRFLLPWWLAALLLLVANGVALWVIATRIEFNNAPELYFPPDAPATLLEKSLRKEFPEDESVVAVFQGDDLFTPAFLRQQHAVAERLARHPLVDRVFAVTTVDHIAASEDGFTVERLVDPGKLDHLTPQELRRRVLDDRFAPGLLVAKDGSALAIVIRPKPLTESRQRQALETAVHEAVKAAGLRDHLVAVAGTVPLDAAELRSMLVDTTALLPIVMGLSLLLLYWVVGRVAPVVIGAVTMMTTMSTTLAMAAYLGKPYTLVTAMVPPLLAAYSTTALIHFYAALARARERGMRRPQRVLWARREIHVASLFNVLTTVAGIASLYFTSIPPIQNYAMIGGVGVGVIYLVVFHLAPPLLVRFDRGRWPTRKTVLSVTDKIAFKIAQFSMRRAGWVVAGLSILVVAAIPLVLKVTPESDLFKFFPAHHPLTISTRIAEDKLSGVIGLEVVFDAPQRDGFKRVAVLKRLKDFQTWLDKQPEVDRTFSMVDLVEEMNWAFHGEDPAFRRLPDTDRALSQLLLIYDGRDLDELTNREFRRTRIAMNLNVHGAVAIGAVIERIRGELERRKLDDLRWDIGGWGRLFADQNALLLSGQVNSFLFAFLTIFLLLALAFRSWRGGLIALIPNLAPLFFIFAIMGLLGMHLDMATVLIAGELLGITVDDTIHLYHGYQRRLEQGLDHTWAVARSFEASGRAVLAVSVLLTAQFLLLTGSQFQPTVDFGLMSATGLIAGQFFELVLLPALLVLWYQHQQNRLRREWARRHPRLAARQGKRP
ncbi:efflux RND transporter permease subunit [Thiobacter aerophilum]|uniref:MMPL family transporter n=1 Tax=Thiobacter aerophilum TaxID=3121275 RepID=A0ABV0ECR9_9BURK